MKTRTHGHQLSREHNGEAVFKIRNAKGKHVRKVPKKTEI